MSSLLVLQIEMDKSPGMVVPYYDADTSILYVAPKGGSSISYFEINDSAPFGATGRRLLVSPLPGLMLLPWSPSSACAG